MPIIINEIEIAVEVTSGNNSSTAGMSSAEGIASKDEIIKECVERVMELINQKKER